MYSQVEGGVEAQARQALKNMKAIVEAGGSEVGKVVNLQRLCVTLPEL